MKDDSDDHPNIDDVVTGASVLLGLPPDEVRALPTAWLVAYCSAYTDFVALHVKLGGAVIANRAVRMSWPEGTFLDNARDMLLNNPN